MTYKVHIQESNETIWKCRSAQLDSSTNISIQQNDITNDTHTRHKSFIVEPSMFRETMIVLKLTLYMGIFYTICSYSKNVPKILVGHLPNSSQLLSATSTIHALMNVFVVYPIYGLTSGLWTLIPQFIGSNHTHLIPLYIQRVFLICFILQIPLTISLCFSKQILYFIGSNKDNDIDWNLIQNGSYACIPYPFGFFIVSILQHTAQYLNLNFEITVIMVVNFIISIGLNYMIINVLGFGFIGGIVCLSLNMYICIILIILLLIYKGYSIIFKPLPFYKLFNTKDIHEYLQLGIPSGTEIFLNSICKDFNIVLSSYISHSTIPVSISYVMKTLIKGHNIQRGVGIASGIRVGKYIGANSIIYAKRCIKIQIFYELLVIIFMFAIYTIFRETLPQLITNDTTVSSLISDKLMCLILLNLINKGIYGNIAPIYRAIGFQKISAYICIISQYVIAYPLCLYLLFSDTYMYCDNMEMGIIVIWSCDSLGYFVANILLAFNLIYFTDWNKAIANSIVRIKVNNENSIHKLSRSV